MDDLIEWLRAVLDEDEAAARAATPGPWAPSGHSVITADDIEISDVPRRDATHIARHDPEQVLADVAAKRSVLDEYESAVRFYAESNGPMTPDVETRGLGAAITLLARAYRHRTGYDSEWER